MSSDPDRMTTGFNFATNLGLRGGILNLKEKLSSGLLTVTVFAVIFAGVLATVGTVVLTTGKGVLDGNYGFVNVDWVVPFIVLGPPIAALLIGIIVTRLIVRRTAVPTLASP